MLSGLCFTPDTGGELTGRGTFQRTITGARTSNIADLYFLGSWAKSDTCTDSIAQLISE